MLLYASGGTPSTTYADFTKSNVQCADSGEETLLTFNSASALYIVMECPSGTAECQVAIGLKWTGEADPLACLVPQELRAGTELNAKSATVAGGEYLQIPAIKPCGAGGSCTGVSFAFTTWGESAQQPAMVRRLQNEPMRPTMTACLATPLPPPVSHRSQEQVRLLDA